MRLSDHVVRVPLFLEGVVALVLEFNMAPPYPQSPPVIRVVTAASWVESEDSVYLVEWLQSQAQARLGRPMVSGLLGMAGTWVEIIRDNHAAREQARQEEELRRLREAEAREQALEAARIRMEKEVQ